MPRATQSQAGKIVEFFRSANIEVAEFAYAQVTEIIRGRRAKSKDAKERAAQPLAVPAASVKPAKKVKAKTRKKRTAPPATSVPSSLPDPGADTAVQQPELAGVGQ